MGIIRLSCWSTQNRLLDINYTVCSLFVLSFLKWAVEVAHLCSISFTLTFKKCIICLRHYSNEPPLSVSTQFGITDVKFLHEYRGKNGLYTETLEKPQLREIEHISHLDILSQGGWLGGVVRKPFWADIVPFKLWCKNRIITRTSYFISTGRYSWRCITCLLSIPPSGKVGFFITSGNKAES